MAHVLTRPLSSSTIPSGTSESVEVGVTDTEVLDSLDVNEVTTIKWLYSVIDEVGEVYTSGEILANVMFNSPKYNHIIVGDIIPHSINITKVGSLVVFDITNNHINNVHISTTRIQVLK